MATFHDFDPTPVFVALNRARVRYMVVGGWAVGAYGAVRATKDLDLIVDFDRTNLRRLAQALSDIGYVPKVPENPEQLADSEVRNRWIRKKDMKVFSFVGRQPPFYLVDIMVKHHGRFDVLYRRRTYARVGAVRIPVVPVGHLLRMKRIAKRPKDMEDVRKLQWLMRHKRRTL